jgi:phage tail-like protein
MRGCVPGLISPHPLGERVPAVLQEDRFGQAFLAGLDEVLAPILATLDNLAAYVDATSTPEDFVGWLGGWLGVELDESWPVERRRLFLARAVELFRRRGTAAGLVAHLEVFTGGSVEVVDSGGVAWSREHGAEPPGDPTPSVRVRVCVDDSATLSERDVDALVAAAKPAHVLHQVEVLAR